MIVVPRSSAQILQSGSKPRNSHDAEVRDPQDLAARNPAISTLLSFLAVPLRRRRDTATLCSGEAAKAQADCERNEPDAAPLTPSRSGSTKALCRRARFVSPPTTAPSARLRSAFGMFQ